MGEAIWRCTGGLICPTQAVQRLASFLLARRLRHRGHGREAGRRSSGRKGWSARRSDIFRLANDPERRAKLAEREGWGERSVEKLLDAIERRRNIAFARFIYALGIPLRQATAGWIARHYRTLETWRGRRAAVKERAKHTDEQKKPEAVGEAYADLCTITGDRHDHGRRHRRVLRRGAQHQPSSTIWRRS